MSKQTVTFVEHELPPDTDAEVSYGMDTAIDLFAGVDAYKCTNPTTYKVDNSDKK